jgi:hypothetical protein
MSDDWPVMVVKWHAISLKRLEHFGELRCTGRWRHYFAREDASRRQFRKASAVAYSTRDGRQEDQLIGTKAESQAERSRITQLARR